MDAVDARRRADYAGMRERRRREREQRAEEHGAWLGRRASRIFYRPWGSRGFRPLRGLVSRAPPATQKIDQKQGLRP